MISAILALTLVSQPPTPPPATAKAARPRTGSVQVLMRMDDPEIAVSKDRSALEEIGSAQDPAGPAAQPKAAREHHDRWSVVTGPLKVRVLTTYRIPRTDPPRELTQVDILEGPSKGQVVWTFRAFLTPTEGLERLLAVPYEERSRQWSEYLARALTQQKPSSAQQAKALSEKRRQKKAARYKATLAREAAEAKAQTDAEEKARKEYREELPYILQAQGQMLQRQSQMEANQIQAERNQILYRFLSGGGYWGTRPALPGGSPAASPAAPADVPAAPPADAPASDSP